MSYKDTVPSRIGNWILEQSLGAGYSGSIWRATNPYTGQVAALKVQRVDHECPTNRYERHFYPSLQGGLGMPTLWAAGVQGEFDYLVIDLLGASLDNLYRQNGRKMDLRSTICIAMQVISRLELMHARGILHRDIQLGNCVIGLPPTEQLIYMIDFGFSKRYIDPHSRKHIPDSKKKRDFIGNYWFSSVNVHCRGKVPSRRDDMEALALMLIHLLTPCGLPWTRNGVPKTDRQQDIIIQEKLRARPDDLCRGLPPVFEEFLRYCRRLSFMEQPNYGQWREEFADLARERGFTDSDGNVSDALVWPPRPEDTPLPLSINSQPLATQRRHGGGMEGTLRASVDIEKVLGDIANLNLNDNQIPGARKEKPSKTGSKDRPTGQAKQQPPNDIIDISSGTDSDPPLTSRRQHRYAKADAIRRLTQQVHHAVDNTELSALMHEFLEVLQVNNSRVVTKEAFDFLAALKKQLDDPSIFMASSGADPKQPGANGGETANGSLTRLRQRPPPTAKVETVKTLRLKMAAAPPTMSNSQLATMITDFSAAVRATAGKTLSKDGYAFLAIVEAQLKKS